MPSKRAWPLRIGSPALDGIEQAYSEAFTRGMRHVDAALTAPRPDHDRRALDGLLMIREGIQGRGWVWLRQPPGPPTPQRALRLPDDLEYVVHY